MTIFTDVWNAAFEALPPDTESVSQGDDRIRDLKKAVRERLEVDHVLNGSADDGEHKKVTYNALVSDPPTVVDRGYTYTKKVLGKVELFWKDEDGNVKQLTDNGVFVGSNLVGEIRLWSVSSIPILWFECNGAAISRTTYSALFSVIGTTYGVGDGSTTFNLPDFRGRSPLGVGQGSTAEGGGPGTNRALADKGGAESHTLTAAESPAHTHRTFSSANRNSNALSGDEWVTKDGVSDGFGDNENYIMGGSASVSPTLAPTDSFGGGAAHNNMHPFLNIKFIIFAGA